MTAADLERALDDAHRTLDAAAERMARAHITWDDAPTDAAERRAQLAWNKAHDAQNRAAQALHRANRALGRPAGDDRRASSSSATIAERAYAIRAELRA